jgi:hypothetical protein
MRCGVLLRTMSDESVECATSIVLRPNVRCHRWLALLALTAAIAAGWEYLCGFPRWYDGHIVFRHTDWFQLSYLCPVPYRHAHVHFYYRDGDAIVMHGRFANYYGNGQLERVGYYRNGQFAGRWCRFDQAGRLEGEEIYLGGRQIGWSVYDGGALHFFHGDLYVGDDKVAVEKFEGGEWKTTRYVGFETVELPRRGVASGPDLCPR